MTSNQFDIRPLDYDASIDRLRGSEFGRISILHEGLPLVLPVTFKVIDDHLTIPTVDTDDAVRLTRDRIVAFEADALSTSGGWSVNVMGFATATDPRFPRGPEAGQIHGHDHNGVVPWKELRGIDIALDMVIGRLFVPRLAAVDRGNETPVLAMDPALVAHVSS